MPRFCRRGQRWSANSNCRRGQTAGNRISGAGHGGDAFAAADEAQAFHGRRLDADAAGIDAEDAGDRVRAWPCGAGRPSAPRTGSSRRRWRCAPPSLRTRCRRIIEEEARAARRAMSDRSAGSARRCRRRRWHRACASVSACKATSASEWPSRRACGGSSRRTAIRDRPARSGARRSRCRCAARAGQPRRQQPLGQRDVLRRSSASCCAPLLATSFTGRPAHSASAASSVKSQRPAAAARRCASRIAA